MKDDHVVAIKQQIKRHEGLRLKPYKCTAGKLTIGYGRNLDDNGISLIEAESLLTADVIAVYKACMKLPFFDFSLDENRRQVIVNMVFNLGMPRFLKFKKMIAALEKKDYETAATEMLNSRWHAQVSSRARELAQMMRER